MPAPETDRPGKVFVGGLASDIDEAILEKYFSHYGRLNEVIVKRDKNTQQTRGYAFITFDDPYDAEDAIKNMDKKEIHGRQIYVEQAVKPRHEQQQTRQPPRVMSRGGGRSVRGGPRGRGRGSSSLGSRRSPVSMRSERQMGRGPDRVGPPRRSSYEAPPRRDLISEIEQKKKLDQAKPWITPELLILVHQKDELSYLAIKDPSLSEKFKKFRNFVIMKLRQAKRDYLDPTGEKRYNNYLERQANKKGLSVEDIKIMEEKKKEEENSGDIKASKEKVEDLKEKVPDLERKLKFQKLLSLQDEKIYEVVTKQSLSNENWSEKGMDNSQQNICDTHVQNFDFDNGPKKFLSTCMSASQGKLSNFQGYHYKNSTRSFQGNNSQLLLLKKENTSHKIKRRSSSENVDGVAREEVPGLVKKLKFHKLLAIQDEKIHDTFNKQTPSKGNWSETWMDDSGPKMCTLKDKHIQNFEFNKSLKNLPSASPSLEKLPSSQIQQDKNVNWNHQENNSQHLFCSTGQGPSQSNNRGQHWPWNDKQATPINNSCCQLSHTKLSAKNNEENLEHPAREINNIKPSSYSFKRNVVQTEPFCQNDQSLLYSKLPGNHDTCRSSSESKILSRFKFGTDNTENLGIINLDSDSSQNANPDIENLKCDSIQNANPDIVRVGCFSSHNTDTQQNQTTIKGQSKTASTNFHSQSIRYSDSSHIIDHSMFPTKYPQSRCHTVSMPHLSQQKNLTQHSSGNVMFTNIRSQTISFMSNDRSGQYNTEDSLNLQSENSRVNVTTCTSCTSELKDLYRPSHISTSPLTQVKESTCQEFYNITMPNQNNIATCSQSYATEKEEFSASKLANYIPKQNQMDLTIPYQRNAIQEKEFSVKQASHNIPKPNQNITITAECDVTQVKQPSASQHSISKANKKNLITSESYATQVKEFSTHEVLNNLPKQNQMNPANTYLHNAIQVNECSASQELYNIHVSKSNKKTANISQIYATQVNEFCASKIPHSITKPNKENIFSFSVPERDLSKSETNKQQIVEIDMSEYHFNRSPNINAETIKLPLQSDYVSPSNEEDEPSLGEDTRMVVLSEPMHCDFLDLPPDLEDGGDRYGGVDRRMDRGPPPRSRDPPLSRSRDDFTPPREYRGLPDSRMGRNSGRDFQQTSRYDPPMRDYSPPPREYQSSREMDYERGPVRGDRLSSRDYGSAPSGRDFNSGPSRGRGGRSSMYTDGPRDRDVYSGGRDRDPPSRDFISSREFSNRSAPRASDFDRVQSRDYDSFREGGRSAQSSRTFSSMGSGRDSAPVRQRAYESPVRIHSSRGVARGPAPSTGRARPTSHSPPPRSRGPPPREERDRESYSAGQRRPAASESRGGPPVKRARPSGPSRGSRSGPPMRR